MLTEVILALSLALSIQAVEPQVEKYHLTTTSDIAQLNIANLSTQEYKSTWQEAILPYTKHLLKPPGITGDKFADEHIQALAMKRGYELQKQAINEKQQYLAQKAFEGMQEAALKDGIRLEKVSGFRSIATQRNLFLTRLNSEIGRGYSFTDVYEGVYDQQINTVLQSVAPPGYSRHHSGYAIDIQDASPDERSRVFSKTKGFEWIAKNKYRNARKYGFIPSYPNESTSQGPEPEAWEYSWVGFINLVRQ